MARSHCSADRASAARPPGAAAEAGIRLAGGVDVIGYFQAELGVGEAGRLLRARLSEDVPVNTIACAGTTSRQDHPFEASGLATHDTVVMAVNADQFGAVRHEFGSAFFENRYIIGQWFWEVEEFPSSLRPAFDLLHEMWVATEHIRTALLAARPRVRVELMPLPLVAPLVACGMTNRISIWRIDFFSYTPSTFSA